MGAAALRFQNLDAAAVSVDKFGHHRQADTRALDVAALGRFALIKGFENSITFIGGDFRGRNPSRPI
jgi:hypothetical protein